MSERKITEIEATKNSRFFIALGQVAQHSFIMAGVMDGETPHALSRVGKQFQYDPRVVKNPSTKGYDILWGQAYEGAIIKEYVADNQNADAYKLHYQAFDIDYTQFIEYLHLLKFLEDKQKERDPIKRSIDELTSKKRSELKKDKPTLNEDSLEWLSYQGIKCYIPKEENDTISFEYNTLNKLSEYASSSTSDISKKMSDVAFERTNKIAIGNTCRTSALDIIRSILGFDTNIPNEFCLRPKYQSEITRGNQFDQNTFFSLPPPPECLQSLSKKERVVFEMVYAKLESIPTQYTSTEKTKTKFEALKTMYLTMYNSRKEPGRDIGSLLGSILNHESANNKQLFEHRSRSLKALFGFETSTKIMFNQIKKILENTPTDNPSTSETQDETNKPK